MTQYLTLCEFLEVQRSLGTSENYTKIEEELRFLVAYNRNSKDVLAFFWCLITETSKSKMV